MQLYWFGRLAPLVAGAFLTFSPLSGSTAFAQSNADPDKPVPPDSYRVVMENDRMRMLEVHIKPHSKIEVDTPANRERFLYMLSDGALILSPPGKKPYEFALHAGETAVFPPVSQTVENDTDAAVRALMVEIKEGGGRALAMRGGKRVKVAKHGKPVMRSATASSAKPSGKPKSTKAVASRSKPAKTRHVAKAAKPKPVAQGAKPPLNLSKAATKPARKVTGKSRGSDG